MSAVETATQDEGVLVPADRLDDLEWCLRYLTECGCDCDPVAPSCATCLAARLHRELFPDGPVPADSPMPEMTLAEAVQQVSVAVGEGLSDITTYEDSRRLQALKTIQDLVPAAPQAEAEDVEAHHGV